MIYDLFIEARMLNYNKQIKIDHRNNVYIRVYV